VFRAMFAMFLCGSTQNLSEYQQRFICRTYADRENRFARKTEIVLLCKETTKN